MYLSNYCRIVKMLPTNCEIYLVLNWTVNCVITNSSVEGKFARTESKCYVAGVTLSTHNNAKLL